MWTHIIIDFPVVTYVVLSAAKWELVYALTRSLEPGQGVGKICCTQSNARCKEIEKMIGELLGQWGCAVFWYLLYQFNNRTRL